MGDHFIIITNRLLHLVNIYLYGMYVPIIACIAFQPLHHTTSSGKANGTVSLLSYPIRNQTGAATQLSRSGGSRRSVNTYWFIPRRRLRCFVLCYVCVCCVCVVNLLSWVCEKKCATAAPSNVCWLSCWIERQIDVHKQSSRSRN